MKGKDQKFSVPNQNHSLQNQAHHKTMPFNITSEGFNETLNINTLNQQFKRKNPENQTSSLDFSLDFAPLSRADKAP